MGGRDREKHLNRNIPFTVRVVSIAKVLRRNEKHSLVGNDPVHKQVCSGEKSTTSAITRDQEFVVNNILGTNYNTTNKNGVDESRGRK